MSTSNNSADRRAVYRVQPLFTDSLKIAIVRGDQRIRADEVLDIAISGTAVRLPADAVAGLPEHADVHVALALPEFRQVIEIPARLIAHEEIDGLKYSRFRFLQPMDNLAADSERCFRLLNRRSVYRGIKPRVGDPVGLEISLDTPPAEFRSVGLSNLSSTGACITVDALLDRTLRAAPGLLVRLQLPGNARSIHLHARLRSRYAVDGNLMYCIQFDWTHAEDPLAQAEELLDYVLSQVSGEIAEPVFH